VICRRASDGFSQTPRHLARGAKDVPALDDRPNADASRYVAHRPPDIGSIL
jgi:hypothetical protein